MKYHELTRHARINATKNFFLYPLYQEYVARNIRVHICQRISSHGIDKRAWIKDVLETHLNGINFSFTVKMDSREKINDIFHIDGVDYFEVNYVFGRYTCVTKPENAELNNALREKFETTFRWFPEIARRVIASYRRYDSEGFNPHMERKVVEYGVEFDTEGNIIP